LGEGEVEKDWYVTQVIRKISKIHYEDFQVIFTGGTALSKAYGLIQRFSEDVDFRVITLILAQK
jgi:predicted nucleotidyltransferase component of viral defense system